MNPEPMEELDFSPLHAIIDEQTDTISELSDQVNQLTDENNNLLLEKHVLERDLEAIRDILDSIATDIARVTR